jgi:uncharacterized delta-60 repeat protein
LPIFFCKPAIERLEDRYLPTCTTGPWCLDTAFGTNGNTDFTINQEVAQSQAVVPETVGTEQRIVMGGFARTPSTQVQEFALARLRPDGSPDTRDFGPTGMRTAQFYATSTENTINAIAVEQAMSSACGDTIATDKIVVAGTARPYNVEQAPSDRVIALMRFCADGTVDTSFGGNPNHWDNGHNGKDPQGGVTVNITDGCGSWMRKGEGLALAIQPDGRIVVGGHGLLSFGCDLAQTNYFVVARLATDGTCIAASLNPGCLDTSFNANDPHNNAGRYYFQVANNHDDEVHALQLVPNGSNFDILVAGRDKVSTTAAAEFAVALVNNSGASVTWTTLVDFTVGNSTPWDSVAWGLARQAASPNAIFVGGTTCPTGCSGLTPQSHFALARLTSAGALDTGFNSTGKLVFDVDAGNTNIGYSVVLQTLAGEQDPRVVIGGYSAPGGTNPTPYMAGGRVLYTGLGTPDTFKWNFSGSSSDGDQVRELRVQTDNKILAGGFHTNSAVPATPDFAIIRLCSSPDPSSCSGPNTPSGGDRQGAPPLAAPDPALVVSLGPVMVALASNSPASVTAMHESPAPPMSDNAVAVAQSMPADVAPLLAPVEMFVSLVMARPGLEATLQDPLAPVAV